MRVRSLNFWIALAFVVAVISAVAEATGRETLPHNDSLIHEADFFVSRGSAVVFIALCMVALFRRIRRRGA